MSNGGAATPLAALVRASSRVAATSSRTAKTGEIAELLRRVPPEDAEIAIAFLSGEPRQGKLAVAHGQLRAAGGKPASEASLGLREVDAAFAALKATRGKGGAGRKLETLRQLFGRATAEEQDFLMRLLVGELRQGALEGIMMDAVALAAGVSAAELRRAASFAGALGPVACAALAEGPAALSRFSVRLMQPVTPMLAQPIEGLPAAMAALGTARLDWKLDGARVQVHRSGDEVRVYTRSLNDVTAAVPEVAAAARASSASSLILDGEAIALRPDGKPHPFQLTMRRLGRREIHAPSQQALPLSVFFFDCLLAEGQSLMDEPLERRRQALEQALPRQHLMPSIVTAEPAEADAFYAEALRAGHEGVMVKAPQSSYEAGRRGGNWLKVKREHTLDLVVLAAEWGHGRRKGWLSNLHLGARDARGGGFVMLGKTFKGLTDDLLRWQTQALLARQISQDEWTVHVRPELVVEITFNDIQQSPQYPGGMALRFARVKRYRPDKAALEADTLDTVRSLFEAQGR